MKAAKHSIAILTAAALLAGGAVTADAHVGEHDARTQHAQMRPGEHMQPGQTRPNQMRPGQMRPGQMRPGQIRPGQMQPGQMGPMMMQRMMRGMMMGMMRGMMGPRRMGMGMMMGRRLTDRKLDVSEVKRIIDGRLAWQGNKRLKVGNVTEKDADTIIAEILTVDGSLVAKMSMNRTSGAMRYAE